MEHTPKPIWPHGDEHKLTPHMGSGQWCRKILGRIRYFGRLNDPDAALRKYLNFIAQRDANKEIREVPTPASDVTLYLAVNRFLTDRLDMVDKGAASAGQYVKYRNACELIMGIFPPETVVGMMMPEDFDRLRAKLRGGPIHVTNQLVCIRAMFNHTRDVYGVTVRYGKKFKPPGKREVAASKRARFLWTAQDIRSVLAAASPPLRCFILLGINCGFGQKDCAALTLNKFTLDAHEFPRPKNGNKRICPLWPATVAAIADYERPSPGEGCANLAFVTRFGNPWVQERVKRSAGGDIIGTVYSDSISQELDKACAAAGVTPRPFYDLRHTFYSVADEVGDPTARDAIMGHTLPGMKEVYSHLLSNRMKRLKAITNHVHDWLFPQVRESRAVASTMPFHGGL